MFPPDEEYHIQRVGGKELSNGLTDSMLARLEKATNMGSGKLPESEAKKWRSIIDKDGAKPQPQQSIVEKKRAPEPPSQNSPISPTTSEPARPSRRGVKRSYQDDSFEGYRESFAEDGRETSAVDNVDDGDPSVHGKRKQRRRVSSTGNQSRVFLSLKSPFAPPAQTKKRGRAARKAPPSG